jgi:hypothetical protein
MQVFVKEPPPYKVFLDIIDMIISEFYHFTSYSLLKTLMGFELAALMD